MFDRSNRVFGLDVLRALAIFFVVYGHGYSLIQMDIPKEIYKIISLDGVSIFFVLSGFLIGRILLRTIAKDNFNSKMLIEFWIRRWFRTLPNYFLILIFIIISFYLLNKPLPKDLVLYFFFSQNIASPHPDFFPEAWSLTVEEWFYLLTPIPLYLFTKLKNVNQRRLILYYILSVIFIVTAFRIYRVHIFNYSTEGDWDIFLRKQVVTRLDSLMFGVLGAYISLYKIHFWNNSANKLFIVGVLLFLFEKSMEYQYRVNGSLFYYNYFTFTVTSLGTLFLLPKLSLWKESTSRFANVVTFISLTSYSMYLLNLTPVKIIILPNFMSFLTTFCENCNDSSLLKYVLYWIITISGSFIIYQYFERPMTALRDKWHVPDSK